MLNGLKLKYETLDYVTTEIKHRDSLLASSLFSLASKIYVRTEYGSVYFNLISLDTEARRSLSLGLI